MFDIISNAIGSAARTIESTLDIATDILTLNIPDKNKIEKLMDNGYDLYQACDVVGVSYEVGKKMVGKGDD